MQQIVVQQDTPSGLAFSTLPEVCAGPGDLAIEATHITLNPGELRNIATKPNGSSIGWDVVGVVAEEAANGKGPSKGSTVLACVESGAWAERVIARTDQVAVVPEGVDLSDAVCLPVAALTAYCALRFGGLLAGKRVLISAAGGSVGQYACQIALCGGADVTAVIRNEHQYADVKMHGVDDIRVADTLEALDPQIDRFDLIVDSLAGPSMTHAVRLLRSHGKYVVFSAAQGSDLATNVWDLVGANGSIIGFDLFSELGRGGETTSELLSRLLHMMASGFITAPVGEEHDWTEIDQVIESFLNGKRHLKPILRVSRTPHHKSTDT